MNHQPFDLGLKQAYDELFMNDAGRAEVRKPKVEEIPLEQISEFPIILLRYRRAKKWID